MTFENTEPEWLASLDDEAYEEACELNCIINDWRSTHPDHTGCHEKMLKYLRRLPIGYAVEDVIGMLDAAYQRVKQ